MWIFVNEHFCRFNIDFMFINYQTVVVVTKQNIRKLQTSHMDKLMDVLCTAALHAHFKTRKIHLVSNSKALPILPYAIVVILNYQVLHPCHKKMIYMMTILILSMFKIWLWNCHWMDFQSISLKCTFCTLPWQ